MQHTHTANLSECFGHAQGCSAQHLRETKSDDSEQQVSLHAVWPAAHVMWLIRRCGRREHAKSPTNSRFAVVSPVAPVAANQLASQASSRMRAPSLLAWQKASYGRHATGGNSTAQHSTAPLNRCILLVSVCL